MTGERSGCPVADSLVQSEETGAPTSGRAVTIPGMAPSLPTGWIRVDCHLHTERSGDACTTLEELEQRVEATGLDVVCITDHHAVSAAQDALARDLGVRVVVGEEIRTPVGELIGLFLHERIPYVLPVEEVVWRIREQGGLVYVPHPYDPIRAGLRDVPLKELCEHGAVDAIEAFNSKIEDDAHNIEAWRTARAYDLPVAAGSDAHDPPGVGAAWVQMPDFDGPESFLASLARGTIVGEYRPHALRFAGRRVAQPSAVSGEVA